MEGGERRAEGGEPERGDDGTTGHRETVGTAFCISFRQAGNPKHVVARRSLCRCRCPEHARGCRRAGRRRRWGSFRGCGGTGRPQKDGVSTAFAAGSLMINSPRMGPCSQRFTAGAQRDEGNAGSPVRFRLGPVFDDGSLACGTRRVSTFRWRLGLPAANWRASSGSHTASIH